MLSHSSPLELVHHLLYVELLCFGCLSSEDRELVQFKTVSDCSPHMQTPSFGHLTIHSSPQVMLVYLTANANPLGLCITGQEVPQKLLHLGNSLAVSHLGILEHLLGMPDLQLASFQFIFGGCTLGPNSLLEIVYCSGQLVNSLGQLPALHVESLLVDLMKDRNDMDKIFLVVPL